MIALGGTMDLNIQGLGIIFFSLYAVRNIAEGEDCFSAHYCEEAAVQQHVQRADLVGFGTGSRGRFRLYFQSGYPEPAKLSSCEFKLRLALVVRGNEVHIGDSHELMNGAPPLPIRRPFASMTASIR